MLITLVRDSVLQCFCHSCRAPVLPAAAGLNGHALAKKQGKIRSKQPKASKKVKFISTEIRCQEKSKGGLRYEVILAEPNLTQVQIPKAVQQPNNSTKEKSLTTQEIADKLKAAEERRLMYEAKKVADWTNKMAKIEEASRKKDELNNEFMVQAKETLINKMEHSEEKREAIITEMKEKLKNHTEEIKRTKEMLEQQKVEERNALNDKLKAAANLRDENIKRILERLREHERRAMIVRQNKATLTANQQVEEVEAVEPVEN
ncbi:stathmin-1-A isoform X2 [Chironomus tepperi]|uniref:stathmin-1-A isoform X2 n=1 Tax=Chironomus tepperi TaxID=113505 RepID=UPI00391FB1B0